MGTSGERRTNKRWPEALKREIVAASYAPGASVSTIARQYDVNANQVFTWRRRYGPAASPASPDMKPKLLPVTVVPEVASTGPLVPGSVPADVVEIEVAGSYVVRVGTHFNAGLLRRILDILVRR
jgi:transposase